VKGRKMNTRHKGKICLPRINNEFEGYERVFREYISTDVVPQEKLQVSLLEDAPVIPDVFVPKCAESSSSTDTQVNKVDALDKVRLILNTHFIQIVRNSPKGNFKLPADVSAKLVEANGGVEDTQHWAHEFGLIRKRKTIAALESIGQLRTLISDDFVGDVMKSLFDEHGDFPQPCSASDITDVGLVLKSSWLKSLCVEYANIIDSSVLMLSKNAAMLPVRTINKLEMESVQKWGDTIIVARQQLLQMHVPGVVAKSSECEKLIWKICARLKLIIKDKVQALIKERRQGIRCRPPGGVDLNQDEQETVYYIAGAVLHGTELHYKRMLQKSNGLGGRSRDEAAEEGDKGIPFVNENVRMLDILSQCCVTQEVAAKASLPIHLVTSRMHRTLKFVSSGFFKFIYYIELVYTENLNTEFLTLYGSHMFQELELLIFNDNDVRDRFSSRVTPITKQSLVLLSIILKKYRKIRQSDYLKSIFEPDHEESLRRQLKGSNGVSKKVKVTIPGEESLSHSKAMYSDVAHSEPVACEASASPAFKNTGFTDHPACLTFMEKLDDSSDGGGESESSDKEYFNSEQIDKNQCPISDDKDLFVEDTYDGAED